MNQTLKIFSLGLLLVVAVAWGVISQQNSRTTNNQNDVLVAQVIEAQPAPSDDELVSAAVPPAAPKNIPIIVYHSIAPKPTHNESAMQKRFRIDPENFRAQMQYLADNDYTPITFDHLANYLLYDVVIPEKPIVLTFDDGTLNQYNYAVPILNEFDFNATFFIYPGVTAHRNFMTWEQLGELVAEGHEVGSHTIIHYNLTTVDDETLHSELVDSKQELEEKLGITITTLAYPHYATDERVRTAVEEAGYIAARAGWRDVKNSVDEIFHLKAQEAKNTKELF